MAYAKVKALWIGWLARRLPHCRTMVGMVSESLEHDLSRRARIRVWAHLLVCMCCRRYQQQLLFIRDAIRDRADSRGAGHTPTHVLPAKARERILNALTREDE
jgi:hypothetical protein